MQTRASVLIQRTPDEVFGYIADTANDRTWRTHLISSHGRITARGDRITQTYAYGGKSQTVELEVSAFEPPERLAYTLHKPASARIAIQCRAEGAATRVSMTMTADLPVGAALFAGRIQSEADKLVRSDLERLKVALESPASR